MSRVTDTVARILANIDGETKAESLGAEEHVEVLRAVADELSARHDRLYPDVQRMREARADMVDEAKRDDVRREREAAHPTPPAMPGFEAPAAAPEPELMPDGSPRPTTGADEPGGNGIESGPHGDPAVPVVAGPENTPATHTDRNAISAEGGPNLASV